MTKEQFKQLTSQTVLLDGATGSYLMAHGMPRGICTESWVLEHKPVIQELQRAYADAGSQIVYAPTFGGNRVNLTKHGLADRLEEINRRLVSYTREAVGNDIFVAGDITTSGKFVDVDDDYSFEDAIHMYAEQIRVLASEGVDVIVAETMLSITETLAAIDACHEASSLPIMCSVTVDAAGGLYMGGDAISAAVAFEEAGADAVGINCSVGPDQLEAVVRSIREAVSIPVIAKPNAGMPSIDSQGNAVYSMKPEDFAAHMNTLIQSGASIVGGCCGTTPDFIRAIHNSLR